MKKTTCLMISIIACIAVLTFLWSTVKVADSITSVVACCSCNPDVTEHEQ